MDFAQILSELWRHRAWLVVGLLVAIVAGLATAYRPSLNPPKLEEKTFEVGSASTDILIDTPRSTAIDLNGVVLPLAQRAATYSRLAGSEPVRRLIAKKLGVPLEAIDASSASPEPGAEERAQQIVNETGTYRVAFSTPEGQPLIDIATLAPTGEGAIALANATADALKEYISQLQGEQRVPKGRRITVRQLGTAEGGVLNEQVNLTSALLVGIAAFIGFCLLILFISRTVAELRHGRRLAGLGAADQVEPEPLAGTPWLMDADELRPHAVSDKVAERASR